MSDEKGKEDIKSGMKTKKPEDDIKSKKKESRKEKDDDVEIVDAKDVEIVDDGKEGKIRKADGARKEKKKGEKADKDGKKEKGEDVEIVDDKKESYTPKQKPENITVLRDGLVLRTQMSHMRPIFRRQEGHRYKRLDTGWRKPRGSHSKLRRHYKFRSKMVSIGYGSPNSVKGLHPSGFEEIMIHNPKELDNVTPGTQAARIAHSVGIKKRFDIEKRADELGIRVLNRS